MGDTFLDSVSGRTAWFGFFQLSLQAAFGHPPGPYAYRVRADA